MLTEYKVVYNGGGGEIVIKKSRFISTIVPIETEEEGILTIEKIKKKYRDAAHNCYAYTLGKNQDIQHCSDDGEPSGTAGKPMLDVLLGENLHNVLVIVTRYFGGTLLGTGGLVRAYQSCVKEGLVKCLILNKIPGVKLQILTDYNGIGKLQYTAAQMGITILDTLYTEAVTAYVLVPLILLGSFTQKWATITNGSSYITKLCDTHFAVHDQKVIVLDD